MFQFECCYFIYFGFRNYHLLVHGFFFGIDMSMAASSREPMAMAETRADASWVFESKSPASSAYSKLLMVT